MREIKILVSVMIKPVSVLDRLRKYHTKLETENRDSSYLTVFSFLSSMPRFDTDIN